MGLCDEVGFVFVFVGGVSVLYSVVVEVVVIE